MRWFFLIFALSFFVINAAQTAQKTAYTKKIADFREGPNTSSPVYVKVKAGTRIELIEKKGRWWRISYGGENMLWTHESNLRYKHLVAKHKAPLNKVPQKDPTLTKKEIALNEEGAKLADPQKTHVTTPDNWSAITENHPTKYNKDGTDNRTWHKRPKKEFDIFLSGGLFKVSCSTSIKTRDKSSLFSFQSNFTAKYNFHHTFTNHILKKLRAEIGFRQGIPQYMISDTIFSAHPLGIRFKPTYHLLDLPRFDFFTGIGFRYFNFSIATPEVAGKSAFDSHKEKGFAVTTETVLYLFETQEVSIGFIIDYYPYQITSNPVPIKSSTAFEGGAYIQLYIYNNCYGRVGGIYDKRIAKPASGDTSITDTYLSFFAGAGIRF